MNPVMNNAITKLGTYNFNTTKFLRPSNLGWSSRVMRMVLIGHNKPWRQGYGVRLEFYYKPYRVRRDIYIYSKPFDRQLCSPRLRHVWMADHQADRVPTYHSAVPVPWANTIGCLHHTVNPTPTIYSDLINTKKSHHTHIMIHISSHDCLDIGAKWNYVFHGSGLN